MPAAPYQPTGNMRGSVSTPDTDPLTPDYEHSSYYSQFSDLNVDPFSQSVPHDGGEVPLGNSIPQLHSYQRGIVPSSPSFNDDVLDEWPLSSGGYNSLQGINTYERMNGLRRNDSLNMQSPIHVPRAIRGSPSYSSDSSSPSRESQAFFGSARPITNTRSNSPAYTDATYNREFKFQKGYQFGQSMTDQQLANLRMLSALQHPSSPSLQETARQHQSEATAAKDVQYLCNSLLAKCNTQAEVSQLIKLMYNMTIQQNQLSEQQQQLSPKSWPPSPQVDAGNEFNFSVMSSTGSSNGSLYGRNSYYNGGVAVPTEQARFEEAARNHRTALASMKQDDCPCYNGEFPIRDNKNPQYSVKVFLGGVPWDITEENLIEDFSRFGHVNVEWPKGVNKGAGLDSQNHKKGYVYVIFENDKQVKALLAACTQDLSKGPDTLFYPVSSKKFKLKLVQVIPWATCDSNYMKSSHTNPSAKCTVFVGALHGIMHAEFLFNVFDSLFQGVVFAGIDTDKYKYPIGSARVMFDNMKSYMRAVNAQFVDIKTQKFQKTVQVDPYLEDSECSYCHHQQGPYFCKASACFSYFCHNCWQVRHPANTPLGAHQPLMRNSKTPSGSNLATQQLAQHRRSAQGLSLTSQLGGRSSSMTSQLGGRSSSMTSQLGGVPAYIGAGPVVGDVAAALLNNNNYYWKNDNAPASAVGPANVNAGAGGDMIRGNLD